MAHTLSKQEFNMVDWVLRIAVAGTFLGHGVFALQVKAGWIPFFTELGFTVEFAQVILPYIGIVDVALAILILVRPVKAALLWMTLWAFWTALLRPLTGDPIWDLVERTANWAAPLALLLLHGWPKKAKDWWV